MELNLQVNIGGLSMKNPITCASGTFGYGKEYSQFFDISTLGAITTKGVSAQKWDGNPTPRIAKTPAGMLNSIGLQNPGVEAFCEQALPWLEARLENQVETQSKAQLDSQSETQPTAQDAKTQDTKVIVNVSGHSKKEYTDVIERLEQEERVDAYEINISCPNVDAGGMAFGTDPKLAASITQACRQKTKRPVFVKLTPNVTDITEIARAVEAAGADAISLINTLLGMAIDVKSKKPKLARVVGGLSGPAIKPVALRCVWQVHNAVDIPLIGMGGITCAEDAIEFMLAGANVVSIGAANFANPYTCPEVLEGISNYCKEEKVADINDLVGALVV